MATSPGWEGGRQLGIGRSSGVEVTQSLYIVFRFADERLTEMHWHMSREGALEAAGLDTA